MLIATLFVAATMATTPGTARQCLALAEGGLAAGLTIDTAEPVDGMPDLPAYCRVRGVIDPAIGFEARLPLDDWNGKYFQAGCGGFCGQVLPDRASRSNAINHALRRGYATITTDGGHSSESLGDARWALDNPAAEAVYGHRVLPLTFAAGHELVERLYGNSPRLSYFSGCSNGGRLGAVAAQRYPELFDGIVIGCPVLHLSLNGGAFGPWVLKANADAEGRPILDHRFTAKLPMLEANAVAQCDGADGSVDGIIAEPFACAVRLSAIPACESQAGAACLTEAERGVVQKWYQGPVDSAGERIFAGMPPGSERYWGFWYLGKKDSPGVGILLARDYGRYLGFIEDPADYRVLDFDFDDDVPKLAAQGELFDALDTDLGSFRDAGGKMILWHGLSDPLVLPQQSRRYFKAVVERFGRDRTAEFLRFFEAPGLGHCWEMPASVPDQMDLLGALERWVEDGVAPDTIALRGRAASADNSPEGTLRPYPQRAVFTLPD